MSERDLFIAALNLTDSAARAALLDQACNSDAAARNRIEFLLREHDKHGDFLEPSATPPGVTPTLPQAADGPFPSSEYHEPATAIGTVIAGKYKLIEAIGEGGMGSVYMAQQTEPVRRMVAVKVIKAGMDSKPVLARFEAERQALALMDHPNIARVFDAGATSTGQPFFVMELVKGVPITQFCDERKLTPKQRLELFVSVCQAIQHAHQKGIIHRDIKPSNVLVALYDFRPVPKVIDFGVAKAAGQTLTDKTLITGFGAVVGTPEYMSPEQASFNQMDVDTRSDVYALGVLLYELLTGSTPLDRKSLGKAVLLEVLRIVREVESPRPSARLSTADALPTIAANRGTEPKALTGLLRSELDWVVMKALEKDRTRRYDTANGLAADVLRYLAGEAVLAHPPSVTYRVKKFARRHRGPLVAAGSVLVALIAGMIGTTWGLVRADRQRAAAETARADEAEQRQLADTQRELAENAKMRAEVKEAEAAAVLAFFEDKVFAAARPQWQDGGLGKDVKLRAAIEASLPFIERGFRDQPLVEARLRDALGTSFFYLGEAEMARTQYAIVLTLRKAKHGPDHPDTLQSMNNLGNSYSRLGRHPDALKLREETLTLKQARLGLDHPDTLASMSNLANSYDDLGRHPEALKLNEETLVLRQARLGPGHPDALASMNNVATSFAALGRHPEALKLHEETLALRKAKLGADHPDTLASMSNMATSYDDLGRHAEALKLYEVTLALQKVKLGADHPDTLQSMNNLAFSYAALNRHPEALQLREETLARQKARVGPEHPDTLQSMNNLATSYAALGRHPEALILNEETLARRKAKLGPDHPDTLGSMNNLATSYAATGRHPEALILNEETLARRKAKLGPDHPDTLASMNNLAATYAVLGRHPEALKLREETLARMRDKLGPDHPDTLVGMANLAGSLIQLKRGVEAIPIIDECVRRAAQQTIPPKSTSTLLNWRLQHFSQENNPAGCQATAVMWENLNRTDVGSLYDAACMRAVTAGIFGRAKKADEAMREADRAMEWLKKTVQAGYKDATHMAEDSDLDALRGLDDFKQLMAGLGFVAPAAKPQAAPVPREVKP